MSRINDHILNNTFYLYRTQTDAIQGIGGGGCGTFIRYPFQPMIDDMKGIHVYAVTNRHVIKEMTDDSGAGPVIRVNTIDGNVATIATISSDWVFHPLGHDLAACWAKIVFGKFEVETIPPTQLLTEEKAMEMNLGVGDDVITVGRFRTHEGKQRNTPVARFGHISMMPLESVYNWYLNMPQESFLVECHSASGNSGAPVLVDPTGVNTQLLGIVWGHLDEYVGVLDNENRPIDPSWRVKYNTGMMVVVPAWRILELLEVDDLKTRREQIEQQALNDYLLKKNSGDT